MTSTLREKDKVKSCHTHARTRLLTWPSLLDLWASRPDGDSDNGFKIIKRCDAMHA